MLLVCALVDFPDPVSHKAGDQSDAELADKSFRCIDHINRIHQIPDGHSQGTAQSAVHAAQKQGAEDTYCIAEMYGCGIAARKGNPDLSEGKYHIGQGCQQSHHRNFIGYILILCHNSHLISH